jgi:hypothetical protein
MRANNSWHICHASFREQPGLKSHLGDEHAYRIVGTSGRQHLHTESACSIHFSSLLRRVRFVARIQSSIPRTPANTLKSGAATSSIRILFFSSLLQSRQFPVIWPAQCPSVRVCIIVVPSCTVILASYRWFSKHDSNTTVFASSQNPASLFRLSTSRLPFMETPASL